MKIARRRSGGGPTPGFWNVIPRPFFALAPMANVTDFAFRSMIATYGKPDVMWTEFVSADGLNSPGREKLLYDLKFSDKERPIVAQLFTGHPEAMREASRMCLELGFDGVDINMGCPDRAVEKQGGGAASIRDPKNAVAIVRAAREGVSDKIPVTIKTRLGYNAVDREWIRVLLEQKLPALTIHLRTRKEMSDVPAHWELMPEIVRMRDEISPSTLIIGNGDVQDIVEAAEKCKTYGCDGIMIGRGIFGAPWLFDRSTNGKRKTERTPTERLNAMLEHARLYETAFKGIKSFAVMKKHFKAYASGWDGAKELRVRLMETENAMQAAKVVREYLKKK